MIVAICMSLISNMQLIQLQLKYTDNITVDWATTLTNKQTSFAVVIVHCKEDNDMTAWYNEIPSSWDVTVYETCQQKVYPNKSTMQRQRWHSVQFQNAGSEECTAYFDYMLHNRDHLADITVFLQTDTFR